MHRCVRADACLCVFISSRHWMYNFLPSSMASDMHYTIHFTTRQLQSTVLQYTQGAAHSAPRLLGWRHYIPFPVMTYTCVVKHWNLFVPLTWLRHWGIAFWLECSHHDTWFLLESSHHDDDCCEGCLYSSMKQFTPDKSFELESKEHEPECCKYISCGCSLIRPAY